MSVHGIKNEFWDASERLIVKMQHERARREDQLLDVNKRLSEATLEQLQAQKSQKTQKTERQDLDSHITPTPSKFVRHLENCSNI